MTHSYPKPWHVGFNGTVCSVYSKDGDCVPWEKVEEAINALRPEEGRVAELEGLLREALEELPGRGNLRRRITQCLPQREPE